MTKQEKEMYELIERYINRDLSPEELESFELKLENDPEFKKEVEAHKEVHQLMMDEGLLDIKRKLDKIHQSGKGGSDNNFWKYISGAAFILITASLLFVFNPFKEEKKTPEANISVENRVGVQLIDSSNNSIEQNDFQTPSNPETRKGKTIGEPRTDSQNLAFKENTNVVLTAPSIDPVISEVSKTSPKMDPVPAKTTAPAKFDCASINITGGVTTTETCQDKENGSIIISLNSLNGGKKPYRFSITEYDYTMSSQFNNLSSGHYKVSVKDANECISLLKEVEVKEKPCAKEYTFNPEREAWQIPLNPNANAEIKILNSRTGTVVYNSSITNGYPDLWDGTDNSGTGLPMGSYSFIISYNNGLVSQGSVTIMR